MSEKLIDIPWFSLGQTDHYRGLKSDIAHVFRDAQCMIDEVQINDIVQTFSLHGFDVVRREGDKTSNRETLLKHNVPVAPVVEPEKPKQEGWQVWMLSFACYRNNMDVRGNIFYFRPVGLEISCNAVCFVENDIAQRGGMSKVVLIAFSPMEIIDTWPDSDSNGEEPRLWLES